MYLKHDMYINGYKYIWTCMKICGNICALLKITSKINWGKIFHKKNHWQLQAHNNAKLDCVCELLSSTNRLPLSCRHSLSLWHNKPVPAGREIAPNTDANATKFFTLATKSWKLVAKLATRTFHYNLTKRYREFKKFAKINPRQTSSLSLFPKRSTCISIDN